MNFDLMKNETLVDDQSISNQEFLALRFSFFKNMIKKDLEVTIWLNKLSEHFNEIQIYSDLRAELNSFEQIVSILMVKKLDFEEGTLEYEISDRCSGFILNLLFLSDVKYNEIDTNDLAYKCTQYLIESMESQKYSLPEAKIFLLELEKKYFRSLDPTFFN